MKVNNWKPSSSCRGILYGSRIASDPIWYFAGETAFNAKRRCGTASHIKVVKKSKGQNGCMCVVYSGHREQAVEGACLQVFGHQCPSPGSSASLLLLRLQRQSTSYRWDLCSPHKGQQTSAHCAEKRPFCVDYRFQNAGKQANLSLQGSCALKGHAGHKVYSSMDHQEASCSPHRAPVHNR
ncbi:UNVERIFIED_CONTAM: hypothetical protein K2H54_000138 [Gekko kuhli]